jgi:hypothetical protein
MIHPEDMWPKYNPGRRDHLHAIGVLANSYNSFEDGMFSLFRYHLSSRKIPRKVIDFMYLSLSEPQRLATIKLAYKECEQRKQVQELVRNLIKYFEWCCDVRNKLIHAQHYPTTIGDNVSNLHLMKRIAKKSPEHGYMELDLQTLRDLADKVEKGKKHCAQVQISMRFRDTPKAKRPAWLIAYGSGPRPKILDIPKTLELSPRPRPQKSSDR